MTSEELAVRVQQGDKRAETELWECCGKLAFYIARRMIRANSGLSDRLERCGAVEDDTRQECFLAVLEAAQDYQPGKGYRFSSYLNYHVMNRLNILAGFRTSRRDALNEAGSLDIPLSGESDTTALELIPDQNAAASYEAVEDGIYREQLRTALEKALDTIPPANAVAVRQRYFEGKALNEIAGKEKSREHARNNVMRGLRMLSRGKAYTLLSGFRQDIIDQYGYGRGRAHKDPTAFTVERLDSELRRLKGEGPGGG